jgi:hypothetical protein
MGGQIGTVPAGGVALRHFRPAWRHLPSVGCRPRGMMWTEQSSLYVFEMMLKVMSKLGVINA